MNWFEGPQDGYRLGSTLWPSSLPGWITALMANMAGSALAGNISDASSSPLIMNNLLRLAILGTVLGSVIETVRKLFRWIIDRFQPRFSVSADFQPGDITYEWLVNYLMKENVWQKPHNIFVKSKNSQRKWKFQTEKGEVDYVPNYGPVQFFRWKGYWMEISRLQDGVTYLPTSGDFEPIHRGGRRGVTTLSLSIYTRDISVLFDFVEECRKKYAENTKTDVTVYSVDSSRYYGSSGEDWSNVKVKRRRPLNSLVLDDSMLETLLDDAREFVNMESWYVAAGIPYRRGYLLYGPPGTGKTSTVYILAGELGLEIYSLSLAGKHMDDSYLARLVTQLPPKAILLIEDIDCAFPTREDIKEQEENPFDPSRKTSEVTFSGLLNVLDGIGSEEGKIFFATTNHVNRLDPALTRPGRIDRQMQYKLTSRKQSHALFIRFYRALEAFNNATGEKDNEKADINELAATFSEAIPEFEFSVAEIQGFLLDWKLNPVGAVDSIHAWVAKQSDLRREQEERKAALAAQRALAEAEHRVKEFQPVIAGIENAMGPKQRKKRNRRHRKDSSDSDDEDSSESDGDTEYSHDVTGSGKNENHERQKKQRRKRKKNGKKLEKGVKDEYGSSQKDRSGVHIASTTNGTVCESA